MSFPSPFASTNGRGNASTSTSNTHLNSYSYSVTSLSASIPVSTSPGPGPSKPRQKSKMQSRLKSHTTDSRSKSKAKVESKPKGNNLRRVRRDIFLEAPDIDTTTRGLNLGSPRDTNALDLNQDQHVHDYLDDTEDDDTEGEGEAQTDRDTEAAPDTSVDGETTLRTLTVDPFSAEEERIITVLSRKLEQLRESETINTSPLSPIETSSPPVPLPLSPIADSIAFGQTQALGPLPAVPIAAAKPIDNGGRFGLDSSTASQLVAGKGKTPSHKHSPKRISPPPISTTTSADTLNGSDKGYPTARAPLHEFSHSRTSSVDSGIYALSPSPAPSSPSSVYAASTASPVNYRNGSVKANTSTRTNDNKKAASNGHAVPIAVNGKGSHHDDDSGVGNGIPIEFNNTYHRTYGAHVSTLSSPEMSLSASPCETYDTRWMGTKVNPNGIGFATANGILSNVTGKARVGRLQTTQAQSYEQESESQTHTQQMLHAFMQENEQLKGRIADMESNYLHLARLNEAYRVELIGYRRRLGLSVDNLIGLSSDPLPMSLSSPPRFTSTSTYPNAQGPHTYRHQHPPSSPLSNAFNNRHAFINSNTNGSNAYHSYSASDASSPSNSTSVLNPPSATTRRTGANYVPSRGNYIPNGIGYENGLNGIAGVTEKGFGTTSASNGITSGMSSTTSTNGVPIPRPPSQVQTNRHKQLPMMTMPMSVPNTGDPLLYMHGSTVNEPQALSTSASSVPSPSYSSPPYSTNSPALFSPAYSSYSAASSSAASSSAASSASASTNVTSPPSSLSFTMMMMLPPTFGVPSRGLSYPLVPPPSLSSSLGSGSGFSGGASGNLSPVEPSGPSNVSRRGSNAGMSVGRRGSFTSGGAVGSVGGRAMDAGSLRRSRGGSLNHGHVSWPETVDETEGDHADVQGLAAIREP